MVPLLVHLIKLTKWLRLDSSWMSHKATAIGSKRVSNRNDTLLAVTAWYAPFDLIAMRG